MLYRPLKCPVLLLCSVWMSDRANEDQMSGLEGRLHSLSTSSLWLCSSLRVVLLHVSTPESLIWGSDHSKSSSKEWPPKYIIFFCLSDLVLRVRQNCLLTSFSFSLLTVPYRCGIKKKRKRKRYKKKTCKDVNPKGKVKW